MQIYATPLLAVFQIYIVLKQKPGGKEVKEPMKKDSHLNVAFYDVIKADDIDPFVITHLIHQSNRETARMQPGWNYAGTYIDKRPGRDEYQRLVEKSASLDLVVASSFRKFGYTIALAMDRVRKFKCPVLFRNPMVRTDMPEWDDYVALLKA